ncbi:hypothetical protein F5J12DRAFT_907396 [Pisolithus orientalis]|uniref:uncharacterized protein n=1 Tax=Pisolithus orientalis TaxID=936130 RepID=UPI00222455DA|nr:uncharacterized protein F5J12DRAFT_907396 [Pisolithus orientalis]KAI5992341.1 hypothetical protein F5J12DRAFT_907396 [Pisolithus orientalis]
MVGASPSIASHATTVSQYDISQWERATYYNGISYDPPDLLYCSDLIEIPIPTPKGRYRYSPYQDPRMIRYSAIQTARFLTHDEDGKDTLGPNAHNASQDILALLEDNGVKGVVVEWYEGAVERLSGLPLLHVTSKIDPTHCVCHFLTVVLGMPIASVEREAADTQGSVALFFHENKDNDGNPSAKVFAITNCHVLHEDTTITYEFKGTGAPRQHHGLDEIKDCISGCGTNANLLAREIVQLEVKLESDDQELVAEDKAEVEAKRNKMAKFKKYIGILEAFYNEIKSHHVHWAPEISVDVQSCKYTKDISRFRDHFKGNVVDLGVKFSPWQLTNMLYPQSGGRTVFKFPINGLLRINGWVPRELLAHPDCFDSNGEPCLIVMKDGNTTDLTAYLCNEFGIECLELAIYNYDRNSGSLIFDGEGHMAGILHSGMGKDGSNHVTYTTPAWWAVEQLKHQCPHADFNRKTF